MRESPPKVLLANMKQPTFIKMNGSEARDYWERVHRAESDDLAAVCHPGRAHIYNRFFDNIQKHAVDNVLRRTLRPRSGARLLDLECGRGRWLDHFRAKFELQCVGIDLSQEAVNTCRRNGLDADVATVTDIPFPDASFDIVSSITVLMHVPDALKPRAFAEVARVLRKNGHFLLLEGTRPQDEATHVFSRGVTDWESLARSVGLSKRHISGHHFTFFNRGLPGRLPWRDMFAIFLDYPLEYLLMKMSFGTPSSIALQHVILFQKTGY